MIQGLNKEQLEKMKSADGFIAALDQSGGSTPKALGYYGVTEDAWSNDEEMFEIVHQMRCRIITSPSFNGDRILAAILFEKTMHGEIEGRPTSDYLWNVKKVVPLLKTDKGLAEEKDGVQLMKPMPELDTLLNQAKDHGVFGTKERSVVKQANETGIAAVVKQQFEVAEQILSHGLVPGIEPEVDINCPDKAKAEEYLKAGILAELDKLSDDKVVLLKLTIPTVDNCYKELIEHPRVVRVVALSGGYEQKEANKRLAKNNGMIASFSRALLENLKAQQSEDEFNKTLDASIQSIFEASKT